MTTKIRTLNCKKSTVYGPVAIRPAVHPDSAEILKKYTKTILHVFDDKSGDLIEVWEYNHSDFKVLNFLLEDDGRGKLRFNSERFPNKIIKTIK